MSFGGRKYYRRDQIEDLSNKCSKDPYPEITDWMSKEGIREMFGMTDSAIYSLVSDRGIPKKSLGGSRALYSRKHIYAAKHAGIDFKKEYYKAEEVSC